MGHYGTANPSVFSQLKDHASGQCTNTGLTISEVIRSNHADQCVTTIAARSCDLLAYAKAGHATANFKKEGGDFLAYRSYHAPRTRMEGGQGKLSEKVTFGFYDFGWQGEEFQMYLLEWQDQNQYIKDFHILTPFSVADSEGHSPAVDKLLLAAGKWTSELHNEIYVFDSGIWVKNPDLWSAVQSSSWSDVILDPAMKDTLISDVQGFFDSRRVYEEYSVPWKRGIIFHSTPGCGKTISIKALMNTLEKREPPVASLYVKSFEGCRGAQFSIRNIFLHARIMAPCLLIFEDLDSLVTDDLRSYFLNEVDGLEDNNGILMVGSTNHLERLDPGISKRPSRFDRKYHFRLPGEKERVLYCEYWKKKLEKSSSIEFEPEICDVVAKMTEGFSFAYMKELFVQTLLTIVGGWENQIDEAALEEVAETTRVTDNSAKLAIGDEKITSAMEENKGAAEGEEESKEIPSEPRKVPNFDIPEHLEGNALMRILRKQVIALLKDMDNSGDVKTVAPPKIPGVDRRAAKRREIAARRAC